MGLWTKKEVRVFFTTLLQSQAGAVCCEGPDPCPEALPSFSQVSADHFFPMSLHSYGATAGTYKGDLPVIWVLHNSTRSLVNSPVINLSSVTSLERAICFLLGQRKHTSNVPQR